MRGGVYDQLPDPGLSGFQPCAGGGGIVACIHTPHLESVQLLPPSRPPLYTSMQISIYTSMLPAATPMDVTMKCPRVLPSPPAGRTYLPPSSGRPSCAHSQSHTNQNCTCKSHSSRPHDRCTGSHTTSPPPYRRRGGVGKHTSGWWVQQADSRCLTRGQGRAGQGRVPLIAPRANTDARMFPACCRLSSQAHLVA